LNDVPLIASTKQIFLVVDPPKEEELINALNKIIHDDIFWDHYSILFY